MQCQISWSIRIEAYLCDNLHNSLAYISGISCRMVGTFYRQSTALEYIFKHRLAVH